MEKRYTVAQAAEMTGVKSYVLRYWEDELDIRIGRNELGHRCYTGYDIQVFMNIKELKNRGLQLKAIKELIPKMSHNAPGSSASKTKLLEGNTREASGEPENTVREAELLKAELFQDEEEEDLPKEDTKILEFQEILERLITQEIRAKNEGERRCRSVDAAIRRQQLARKEAAASVERKRNKKGSS